MTKQRPKSRSDVPWTKRQEIPDRQIVDAADQYAAACELLAPLSGVLRPQINAAAVSIELYLKSLNAERIYTTDKDMHEMDKDMPEISKVSSYPAKAGHPLHVQFAEISKEIRDQLIAAYNAKLRLKLKDDLETALEKIEGAFLVSRYSFEPDADVSKYSLPHLMGLVKFLRGFVKWLPSRQHVQWEEDHMTSDDVLGQILAATNFPAVEDIKTLPDRAAGIVSAAIIDDRLTVAVKSRLIPNSSLAEDVFGKRVRRGDFGLKIDLGYLLGIYDAGHHKALHAVREIRNKFAHEPGPIDFDSKLVAMFIKELEFAKILHAGPDKIIPRCQFDLAATYFLGMLIVAAEEPRPKFKPVKFDFALGNAGNSLLRTEGDNGDVG
jgi:hypothetical protein